MGHSIFFKSFLFVILLVNYSRGQQETVFKSQFERLHHPPLENDDWISSENFEEEHFEQLLDHFNESETRKWTQKYLTNSEHFNKSGPIFIFVGGEWRINPSLVTKGHIYDMAKDLNAYLFALEHRFYGNEPELPSTLDSLQFLTSQQAVKDLKTFIQHIKKTYSGLSDSKVFLFGSGYSASLVTWFMKENSDMISTAWASGAPTIAKMNFDEYQFIVGEMILKFSGLECYNRIENGFRDIENMLRTGKSAEVKALLKICNNFNHKDEDDISALFSGMAKEFAILVENHKNTNLSEACSLINSAPNDAAGVAKLILKQLKGNNCNDFSYRSVLESVGDSSWTNTSFGNPRKWLYQSCNELGWFPTSNDELPIFQNNHRDDFFVSICMDALGNRFTKNHIIDNVLLTNVKYHGSAMKTYFTYGEMDPWKTVGTTSKSFVLPLESHCSDFESISDNDSNELKASKERIFNLIKQIVKE